MKFSLIAAAAVVLAGPAGAVSYTYNYDGPDLVCDVEFGDCSMGTAIPAETGSFSVDADNAGFGGGNIVFSVRYSDRFEYFEESLFFKGTGETRISETCDGVDPSFDDPCVSYTLPDFFTEAGILAGYSTPAFDEDFEVTLDFTGGALVAWYLERSSDSCALGVYANVIRSAQEGCGDAPGFDFQGDNFERYAASASGAWARTETPAPIPLPAAGWLLAGGLGGLGAFARRRARGG